MTSSNTQLNLVWENMPLTQRQKQTSETGAQERERERERMNKESDRLSDSFCIVLLVEGNCFGPD